MKTEIAQTNRHYKITAAKNEECILAADKDSCLLVVNEESHTTKTY
jgi:hypothetical protein